MRTPKKLKRGDLLFEVFFPVSAGRSDLGDYFGQIGSDAGDLSFRRAVEDVVTDLNPKALTYRLDCFFVGF